MVDTANGACVHFNTLDQAIRLPNTPSSYVREKIYAIELCTKKCGRVKVDCSDIINTALEAESTV